MLATEKYYDSYFNFLVVLGLLGALGDYGITYYGLQKGLMEGNKFVNEILQLFGQELGFIVLVLLNLLFYGLIFVARYKDKYAERVRYLYHFVLLLFVLSRVFLIGGWFALISNGCW